MWFARQTIHPRTRGAHDVTPTPPDIPTRLERECLTSDTRQVTTATVTAGLGFLAGILWLDLIFDVQILGIREHEDLRRADALNSVATYYRHATGGARRLDLFIALVMVLTLA